MSVRDTLVGVASRSFSRHPVLRAELLARYPNARFNDSGASLADESLAGFLGECPKAIIALERVDRQLLDRLPRLRVISKYGVGLDMLDLQAMEQRGIALGWTPGVNRRSVAELVVSFAIALLHRVPEAAADVRGGRWRQIVGRQLTGRTVGVIGCGHVGKEVCILMRAFGCRLLAHDIRDYPDFYRSAGVQPVSLDELLTQAEIVTLHLPLDASTRNILDGRAVDRMRRGAILINAARGGLVDEKAVAHGLREGRLAGAAFDVLAIEPPDECALLELDTVIVSPHIGGSTEEAILAMGRAAIDGLESEALPSALVPDFEREHA